MLCLEFTVNGFVPENKILIMPNDTPYGAYPNSIGTYHGNGEFIELVFGNIILFCFNVFTLAIDNFMPFMYTVFRITIHNIVPFVCNVIVLMIPSWQWFITMYVLHLMIRAVLDPKEIWQIYEEIGLCKLVTVTTSTSSEQVSYTYYRCLEHEYPEYWFGHAYKLDLPKLN